MGKNRKNFYCRFLRIGPFWVDEKKFFFWSKNFLRPEPGWPHNGKKIENFFIADFCELDHLETFFKKFFFSKNAKFCKILENFGKFPIIEPDFHPEDDK